MLPTRTPIDESVFSPSDCVESVPEISKAGHDVAAEELVWLVSSEGGHTSSHPVPAKVY